MKTILSLCLTALVLAPVGRAAAADFDFNDPKHGNNAVFKLVAPKETIEGAANGITGTIAFDAQNPAATKGKIIVDAKTLTVPNAMMKQHIQNGTWLDVAKYPTIAFEVKELKNAKTEADKTTADAVGTFTLKDVSKEITVPVTLTYLKGKLGDRMPGKQGDLLVVHANFSILRSDFNVNAHKNEDKVADKIELSLGIAGAAATAK